MNVCMVGTGYVGLVAGTCLSDFGINVTCVDNQEDKITRLKNGEVPILHPVLLKIKEKLNQNAFGKIM